MRVDDYSIVVKSITSASLPFLDDESFVPAHAAGWVLDNFNDSVHVVSHPEVETNCVASGRPFLLPDEYTTLYIAGDENSGSSV